MKNDIRESNIELLKVIAVFMIVLCHTGISMTYTSSGHSTAAWFYDINSLPNSLEKFILTLINYCGYLGNDIFFICSAWFMVDRKHSHKSKILKMESDVWIISVLYLAVFVVCGIHVQRSTVIRALLPTAFNNNWFASAYMFFYAFFPFLNQCFERIPRGCQKYGCIVFAVSACFVLPFLLDVFKFRFSISYPMMWVVAYCCVSYLKTYHRKLLDSRKFAIVVLLIGISGLIGEIAATYYFGPGIRLFHGDGMRWNKCYNLFEWFFAFGCFNLVRTFRFHSLLINRISSLSLLIYLIHGNFLVRRHVRPYLYSIIHYHLHDRNIPLWLLMFSILIFIASALLAYLYQKSIQKIAYQIADNSCNAVAGHMRKHIRFEKVRHAREHA